MTVGTPAWIAASGGSPSYDATELRVIDSMYATYDGSPTGGRSGRRPGGTGLNVSVSGSPLNWNVAPGVACISGVATGQLGVYVVPVTATESGAMTAADATFPRKDILVLKVEDAEAGDANRQASVAYIVGTPAATPSAPSVPARSFLLATIDVPVSGSPAVTQNAVYTVASGGILPTATRPASPYAGMAIYNLTSGIMEYYNGSAWLPLSGGAPAFFTQTVAGSGTWTKPANAKYVVVELWGGGGAGGGTSPTGGDGSGQAEGAGGGGGGYVRKLYAASDLNATEAFTVGAGGTAVSGAAGGAGGSSTFKGLTAGGGGGGAVMLQKSTNAGANRGAGGTASGGDLNLVGDYGGSGRVISGQAVFTGQGGASPNGGGRITYPAFNAGNGAAGLIPGGGGSGAFAANTNQSGGGGAVGKIIVTTYF